MDFVEASQVKALARAQEMANYHRALETDDDRPDDECPVCGTNIQPFLDNQMRYRGHYSGGNFTASNDPGRLCLVTDDMLAARVIRRKIIRDYESKHGVPE